MGVLEGINKKMHMTHLTQCLAYSTSVLNFHCGYHYDFYYSKGGGGQYPGLLKATCFKSYKSGSSG